MVPEAKVQSTEVGIGLGTATGRLGAAAQPMRRESRTSTIERHLRPDGRVRRARRRWSRGRRGARRRATARWTPTRPFPIEELHRRARPAATRSCRCIVLGGGLDRRARPATALQYWASAIAYPLNIGGRPLHSWPSFIVPAFETTILFAALAAVLGMIALNGLPHAVPPGVQRRSGSRWRAATGSSSASKPTDPKFDQTTTRRFLESLEPREVSDVER